MEPSISKPTANDSPTSSRLSSTAWFGLGLPITFACHTSAMFAVYAAGSGSELWFFALPFVVAFSAYYFVLSRSGVTHTSRLSRGIMAFAFSCVSCVVAMSWSFTRFGT
jgi:hypothetical protein